MYDVPILEIDHDLGHLHQKISHFGLSDCLPFLHHIAQTLDQGQTTPPLHSSMMM